MNQTIDRFVIAGGTVPGTDHTKPGEPFWRNNNDAYAFFQDEAVAIMVVADGCGSSLALQTEVGSHIVARLVTEAIRNRAQQINDLPMGYHEYEPEIFSEIRTEILERIKALAEAMGQRPREIVHTYFMATIVGCIATAEKLTTFSIGDGYICINDELQTLGPFKNNEPPYLAYGLLGTKTEGKNSQTFAFKCETRDLADVEQVLIGTDGLEDLIRHETAQLLKDSGINPLSKFFADRCFKNPDIIRRTLALLNQEQAVLDEGTKHPRIQKGLLHDDTTLVVMKKNSHSQNPST